MKVIDALKKSIILLKEYNINEPIQKARILLADLLNIRKADLIIKENMELDINIINKYFDNIQKLCNNYPLQYITKKQEFMGNVIEVNESVLIPRQDTEILVEEALKYAHGNILELCTGSGAIAISIAKSCHDVKIIATDISEMALEVAKRNSEKHKANVNFIKSDLFQNVIGKYNLIVSNPPYIETKTIYNLEEQVKKEPIIALDGGKDGLDFYRKIAENAYNYLNMGGYLCLEIGYNQKDKVIQLLENKYTNIKCVKDLSGNDRVITCKWEG